MSKKIDLLSSIPEINKKNINVSDTLKTLKEQKKLEEQPINISFKFFDRENEMFNLGNADLDSLQLLTKITRKQLFNEYKNKFKPHPYERTY